MNLSVIPSEENVTTLYNNIVNMDRQSQLVKLYSYEKYLVENELEKRCIVFLCGRDRHEMINTVENIDTTDWLRLEKGVDINEFPDNYIDVILWNDCNLKDVIRDTRLFYPKLKSGARVYVENVKDRYKILLNESLTPNEIEQLESTLSHKKVLSRLVNQGEQKYSIRSINCGKQEYTIFIKGYRPIKVSDKLQEEFVHFDSTVAKRLGKIHIIDDYPNQKRKVTTESSSVKRPRIMSGPRNVGGVSCFMDSVLYPLLITDNKLVSEMLTKNITGNTICNNENPDYVKDLQSQLRNMKQTAADGTLQSCSMFIRDFKKCNANTEELMNGEQQDDSEFLQILFQLFDIEPTIVRNKNGDRENLVTLEIPINESINESPVAVFQKNYDIMKSDGLIFHINRTDYHVVNGNVRFTKNNEPIKIDKCIGNKKTNYYLKIITCHNGSAVGGHYTAFFNKLGTWYRYDDLDSPTVRKVEWRNIQNIAETQSSMLFYF